MFFKEGRNTGMKKKSIINCPKCHSHSFRVIATTRGFGFDKAATGAIIGGLIGGSCLGLAAICGIDGKRGKSYLQCSVCGKIGRNKI